MNMNRFWKNLAALLVLLAVIIIGFLWYMGYFGSYEVDVRSMGPYNFVYEEYTGSYAQSGSVFTQVHDILLEDGIGTTVWLGIYYDNPVEVSDHDLRSELGSIVDEVQVTILPEDYNFKIIDATEYAVVKFPYKNMLSYMLGPVVAYPVLEEYFSDDADFEYTIELYTEDAIYYMIEVTR